MKFVIIFCLLFIPLLTTTALEVSSEFDMANLYLPQSRGENESGFTAADFYLGTAIGVNHAFDEYLSINGSYQIDPILRHILFVDFNYTYQYVTLSVGPFAGLFNSNSAPMKTGLSASLHFELPGVFFVDTTLRRTANFLNFSYEDSIPQNSTSIDNYTQELNSLSVGFYILNTICDFTMLNKLYIQNDVIDAFSEYAFNVEMFQKNVPYRVLLSFAYQVRSKDYWTGSSYRKHRLGSLVLGTEIIVDISDDIKYFIMADNSLYTFGQEYLLGISISDRYLFSASTGVSVNMDFLFEDEFNEEF